MGCEGGGTGEVECEPAAAAAARRSVCSDRPDIASPPGQSATCLHHAELSRAAQTAGRSAHGAGGGQRADRRRRLTATEGRRGGASRARLSARAASCIAAGLSPSSGNMHGGSVRGGVLLGALKGRRVGETTMECAERSELMPHASCRGRGGGEPTHQPMLDAAGDE